MSKSDNFAGRPIATVMKIENFATSVLLFAGLIFLNGCSSCNDVRPENTNQNSTAEIIKPTRAQNSDVPVSNSAPKPYPGLENGKNPTLDNANVKIINTANAPVRLPSKRLRDNSELSTTMNKEGAFVESRKFLDNAKLEKLERITKSPKDVRLRVHLRDGRVIEVSQSKIKNFRFDRADTILEAAGVESAKNKDERRAMEKEDIMKRKSASESRPNP